MGVADYAEALALQDAMVDARLRDAIGDTLLLLAHPHVYTLGRGADERYLLNPPPDVPIYRVSRGGQVTYHGPGQLVGYPILKLEGADRDVHRYLRQLERAMIAALAAIGVEAARRDGLTGVWVGPAATAGSAATAKTENETAETAKIGAIGVGLRRWVTRHGFALNVTTDLRYFDAIVPCGIEGCRVTSIAALGRPEITVESFADVMAPAFSRVFGFARIVDAPAVTMWAMVDRAAPAAQDYSQVSHG
jgi:lipoate-protein ligase B